MTDTRKPTDDEVRAASRKLAALLDAEDARRGRIDGRRGRIVENQRKAYLARSMDAARNLARELANISDAGRAAILATLAADTSTPIDLVFITGEPGDAEEIRYLLAGVLRPGAEPDSYLIGSGCELRVVAAPGTEHP